MVSQSSYLRVPQIFNATVTRSKTDFNLTCTFVFNLTASFYLNLTCPVSFSTCTLVLFVISVLFHLCFCKVLLLHTMSASRLTFQAFHAIVDLFDNCIWQIHSTKPHKYVFNCRGFKFRALNGTFAFQVLIFSSCVECTTTTSRDSEYTTYLREQWAEETCTFIILGNASLQKLNMFHWVPS